MLFSQQKGSRRREGQRLKRRLMELSRSELHISNSIVQRESLVAGGKESITWK